MLQRAEDGLAKMGFKRTAVRWRWGEERDGLRHQRLQRALGRFDLRVDGDHRFFGLLLLEAHADERALHLREQRARRFVVLALRLALFDAVRDVLLAERFLRRTAIMGPA